MSCTRPIAGYRSPDGKVVMTSRGGYVDRQIQVQCGQCFDCRMRRAKDWAVRCMHESEMHERNSFLTLTYDDEHLPEDGGLDVTHWQLFAKRLRKKLGPFRYLHCGEYGEQRGRPHYHALLFGQNFSGDREPWSKRGDHQTYVSDEATQTWGLGNVEIGSVTYESAAYVAGYVLKKLTGPEGEVAYSRHDPSTGSTWNVRPPYITMSRRPGIGRTWYDQFKSDCYPSDFVVVNGSQRAVPRYYDNILEVEDPSLLEEMKFKRREAASSSTPEQQKINERTHEKDFAFYASLSGSLPE